MEAQELASYKYQLEQVETLLANDPENAEMLKLKTDLQELISLSAGLVSEVSDTRKHATTLASPTSVDKANSPVAEEEEDVDVLLRRVENDLSSRPITMPDEELSVVTPTSKWAVGDRIRARYKNDGKFYSARVVSVGGSDAAPVYSVVFKGYEGDAPEIVAHADTYPLAGAKSSNYNRGVKRSAPTSSVPGEDAEKKLKGTAARKQRQQEQRERQQSWLTFASGTKKKTVKKVTSVINKKSIFATPDNAAGRVGVVGSGRPMTQFGTRSKHVYDGK